MSAPDLFDAINAPSFVKEVDSDRITALLDRVRDYMVGTGWHTLKDIREACGGSEAGISARLRDLRKAPFGGYQVDRQRVPGTRGLWRYRVWPRTGR